MIVRMVSYLPDFGSFVMKSIATVWNGSPSDGVMGIIVKVLQDLGMLDVSVEL